jgi:hypothetical protein
VLVLIRIEVEGDGSRVVVVDRIQHVDYYDKI